MTRRETDAASTSPLEPAGAVEPEFAAAALAMVPLPDASAGAVPDGPPNGLTSAEAGRRLERFGPNAVSDTTLHPWRMALTKFWAPVPWMLEAAILLQLALGEYVDAAIIAGLLVFNAVLGFLQEGKAQATLAALKSRLALTAVVRRDGVWTTVPAARLAPGDVVKLSLGAVVAADVRLVEGTILLDQSMLTGESIPIEAGPNFQTFADAGAARRGDRGGDGDRAAHPVRTNRAVGPSAHVVSSQQKAVLRVVRNLAVFNGVLIVLLVGYAFALGLPFFEVLPLVLTAILASIPVALPATFTLATALRNRAWRGGASFRRASPPWTRRRPSTCFARIRPAP